MNTSGEPEKFLQVKLVAYFKVLFRLWPGESGYNYDYPMHRQRIETRLSRI
jgi:hypothetical protein